MNAILEDDLDDDGPFGPSVGDVESLERTISDTDASWSSPEDAISLGEDLAWRPNLVHANGHVLHVHLTQTLPTHVVRRLERARVTGRRVHVALELSHLYRADVVRELARLDAYVLLVSLEADGWRISRPDHVLAIIADEQIPVEAHLRSVVGQAVWERLDAGTSWDRGKRLEALLAFLLSQIRDLRVRSRNYRTDTEEIDIVLQIDNPSNRCWHKSGVPFVLVEAKNRASMTDQSDVTAFIGKILTKRGKVEIGLLFSTSGFTSDAVLQETKMGQSQQIVVALIGPEELHGWIVSESADEFLEDIISAAMLR